MNSSLTLRERARGFVPTEGDEHREGVADWRCRCDHIAHQLSKLSEIGFDEILLSWGVTDASAGVRSKLKTVRAVRCRKSYPDHALGWVGTISRSRRGERTSLLESYQSVGFMRRGSPAFFKSVGLISMRFLGLALANLSQVKQAVLIIGPGLRHS
jgi:hypothetical protein